MTDLLSTLPDFPTAGYTHLIPSLEKNGITVADLLTLDPIEIVKRCPLPLLDVRRLIKEVIEALQADIGIGDVPLTTSDDLFAPEDKGEVDQATAAFRKHVQKWSQISTLDDALDRALDRGIPTGYVTEVTGESGAGKTQFLLTLLLSAQLPSPQGLSRSTIYISTEAQLSTIRLNQILTNHPRLRDLPVSTRPSLANVRAIPVQDLEVQEHILEYQLPIAVRRYNVGLVVIDSVAANYRAEHGSSVPKDLANRAAQLAKLGRILRRLAVSENLAIVVANQVSDRFEQVPDRVFQDLRSSSPAMSSSPSSQARPSNGANIHVTEAARAETMSLDHQQRFFTGWGDEPGHGGEDLKTPALGLGWTNQIAARIVLKMEGARSAGQSAGSGAEGYAGGNIWQDRKKKRFMSVVFAPWTRATLTPVEFEIRQEGLVSVDTSRRSQDEKAKEVI